MSHHCYRMRCWEAARHLSHLFLLLLNAWTVNHELLLLWSISHEKNVSKYFKIIPLMLQRHLPVLAGLEYSDIHFWWASIQFSVLWSEYSFVCLFVWYMSAINANMLSAHSCTTLVFNRLCVWLRSSYVKTPLVYQLKWNTSYLKLTFTYAHTHPWMLFLFGKSYSADATDLRLINK